MPDNSKLGGAEPTVVDPDNVRAVYSNVTGVRSSIADVRLLFAEAFPRGSATVAELRVSVVMNPMIAKGFALSLLEQLKKYEQEHGEIQWPPKDQKLAAAKIAQ